jgi:hypothetical protein
MLLVLRPGAVPLTPGIMAAIIAAITTGYSIVAMRSLVGVDDARAVAAWTFILTTIPSLFVALFVWTTPPVAVWPLLAAIGAAAAIGQLTLTRAFSLSEACRRHRRRLGPRRRHRPRAGRHGVKVAIFDLNAEKGEAWPRNSAACSAMST